MRRNLLLLLGFMFLFAFSAAAQNTCVPIQGLGQAELVFDGSLLKPEDIWGGSFYLSLGGQEFLVGFFSGQDGTDYWRGRNDSMGQGKGGSYTFAFNKQPDGTYIDSITTTVTNAVFPSPPGKRGFGFYQAAHKITSGTGRFTDASGNILVSGSYVGFLLSDGTLLGRWNPDVSGKICQ